MNIASTALQIRVIRYVLPAKFEELTGYTVKAQERKIEDGVWREGHEYKKAPDGRILINLEGFHQWVENQKQAV